MDQQPALRKIAEGREAEIFAGEEGRVVKLFRRPDAGRQAAWEAAAMAAAGSVGNLVPATYGVAELMGRPGLIMERVEGRDLLAMVERRPWLVVKVGRILGELHARLHEVAAPEGLPSLMDRAAAAQGASQVPTDVRAFALAVLESLPDGDRLCHFDFHPANVIVSARGPVVIDWPNASRGDPTADVARTLLLVRVGKLPPGASPFLRLLAAAGRRLLTSGYLQGYRRLRSLDGDALRRWGTVNAALRLAEDIPGERESLLRSLRRDMGADAGQ